MYDVIVVGAGPAGSTAAKVLAERGMRVLLVERHKLPRYKSCSGVLIQKSIDLVQYYKCFIVEAAVPAAPPVRTNEGDALPGVGPNDLIPFDLHILNKALPVNGVLQRLVDGLEQVQLPAVPAEAGLVFSGSHPLPFRLLLWHFQNAQAA